MAQSGNGGNARRPKRILGLSPGQLAVLLALGGLVVCVFVGGLAYIIILSSSGPTQALVVVTSTPVPSPDSASIATALPTVVQEFAGSDFCRKYRCVRYAVQTIGGITGYYYQTDLSAGATEAEVYIRPSGAVEYDLDLQPVSATGFLDESKVQWEDPQAAFDFLNSGAPSAQLDDELKSTVRHDLLQHLNHICDANPINLGNLQAWIGRGQFYEQDIIVATTCPGAATNKGLP